jgi:tetratricopeptide (TPR) repeat protein
MVALEPDEPRWSYRLSRLLLADGREDDGLRLLEVAIRRAPDYLPARLRLGDALLKANRSREAEIAFGEVLGREPSNPYALLGLARLDVASQRWAAARDKLEKAVAASRYGVGYDLLPTVYEHLGRPDQAAEVIARMKASGAYADFADPWLDELIDYDYDPYRVSIAAGAADHRGDLPAAMHILERALQLAPDNVMLHHQMATFHLREGDLSQARSEWERCVVLAPDFADGWAYLSWVQARQGDQRAAAQTLVAGLGHCPASPGLHLDYARMLATAGRFADAVPHFESSIRLRPEEAQAYVELAQVYFRLERLDAALATLQRAQQAEPENPDVLTWLGFYSIAAGDREAARGWVRRAQAQVRIQPENLNLLVRAFRERFGAEP